MRENGLALEFAPEDMKRDAVIVLIAAQHDIFTLAYTSEETQSNVPVVTAAIQQNGSALAFASERAKNNEAVFLAAEQQIAKTAIGHAHCPNGHVLKEYQSPQVTYFCNVFKQRFPKGTQRCACRICSYDVCAV